MYEVSKHYLGCSVAGFEYWDGIAVLDELKVGASLDVKVEPENPYDPQAVALFCKGIKIGYIPREYNGMLFPLLYFGYTDIFEVFISRVDFEAHPNKQLSVVARIKDIRTV